MDLGGGLSVCVRMCMCGERGRCLKGYCSALGTTESGMLLSGYRVSGDQVDMYTLDYFTSYKDMFVDRDMIQLRPYALSAVIDYMSLSHSGTEYLIYEGLPKMDTGKG